MKRTKRFLLVSSTIFCLNLNAMQPAVVLALQADNSCEDSDGINHILQDRHNPGAFDYMMSELQRVHKSVYSLPYSYDYIKNTLMPQVEAKRHELAPHWPGRELYGEDQDKGTLLFKEWYEQYPLESKAYIEFVDDFVQQHSK